MKSVVPDSQKHIYESGMILVMVVLITSAILAVGLGIFSSVFNQLRSASETKYSFNAFYAADQGIERTLYLDRQIGPLCPSAVIDGVGDIDCYVLDDFPVGNNACVTVKVGKDIQCDETEEAGWTRIRSTGLYQCGSGELGVKRAFCLNYSAAIAPHSGAWWDSDYQFRQVATVTAGANVPSGGYDGYTARFFMDTATLIAAGKMLANCDDLRVVWLDGGGGWQEIDRHLLNCDNASSDIRFLLKQDIAPSSDDPSYYVYYGNLSATAPNPLNTTNVYLWYDDALSDRLSSYILGRGDNWWGSGYAVFIYEAASAWYRNDTGDNFTGSMRRQVNERDAYIEAEMYHSGCYPSNMSSGLLGRYIIESGFGSTESASHYYASERAHQASCGSGYSHDGDISESNLGSLGINGTNPSAISINQWRKQGLALWGINNTDGKFWDSNTVGGFGPVGWPSVGSNASGSDASDQEGAGDWGVIAAQDDVRIRNVLIRRYVEPEPTTALGGEETP